MNEHHQTRTGLVLRDPLPWPQELQIAQTAEETGYDALFVPEMAAREAFGMLAGVAGATERILLGTGVITIRSRAPFLAATAAATLQDMTGGRTILGLGSGSPPAPGERAGDGPGPLESVRRYVEVLRQALDGQAVEDPRHAPGPLRLELRTAPPPIWLGALGDRMISLAGEIADGVLLNWCTPERVREANRIVGEAARSAGRDASQVTVAVYVRACLGVEEPIALDALSGMAARYAAIPHYRSQMRAMGLGEEADAAVRAFEAGDARLVPERLVRALTVSGGREDALQRFQAYRTAGADLVLCYPVPALDPFSSILGTLLAAAPSTVVDH